MVDEARGFTFITQGEGEAQRAMQSCSPYTLKSTTPKGSKAGRCAEVESAEATAASVRTHGGYVSSSRLGSS